jgi:iron complex outermembrane receptor protein
VVNGPANKTSGIDVLANYTVDDFAGGSLGLGGSVTYVQEFTVAETEVEGVVVSPAFDGVNKLNYQTQIVPVPQWKAQLFAEYSRDIHNLRLTLNYIDSYIDQRTSPYPPAVLLNIDGTTRPTSNEGRKLDAFMTFDASYRVLLPWDVTAVVTVDNIFDEDPPFARLDLGYDPFTANPLGRTYKLNVTKKF